MSESLPVAHNQEKFDWAVPNAYSELDVAAFYLASFRSGNSNRCIRSRLDVMAKLMGFKNCHKVPWSELRLIHYTKLIQIMSEMKKEDGSDFYSGSTINTYISAIRGISEAAWSLELMSEEDVARIRKIKKVRSSRLSVGRELSFEETGELLKNSSGQKIAEIRDHAILSILIGTGIRRAEISSIRFERLNLRQGFFKIIGKGDKERKVFMPDETVEALEEWIEVRGTKNFGPVFVRIRRFGVIDDRAPLTPEAVGLILNKYVELSGITERVTPHDLRRTFATRLIKENVDLVTVRDIMGHASVVTTANYDRRGESAMKEGIKKVRMK